MATKPSIARPRSVALNFPPGGDSCQECPNRRWIVLPQSQGIAVVARNPQVDARSVCPDHSWPP